MERKFVVSVAICATVALILLICIVIDLASHTSAVVAPTAHTTSGAMDSTTATTGPPLPDIYAACGNGGLRTYSLTGSSLGTIHSIAKVSAVTYDFIRHKVYWSRFYAGGTIKSTFYRAGATGNDLETLLDTPENGRIHGLGFDWIANLIYAVSLQGQVIACSAAPFSCATIVARGPGKNLEGITVDPIHGRIYWTEGNRNGSIFSSGTDGSNPVQLIGAQNAPRGIVIDFDEWRLYWTCQGDHLVRSSNMEGGELRVLRISGNAAPQGIAVRGDRIYWTDQFAFTLESIRKNGEDNRTLNTVESYHLYHLAMPTLNPPSGRINHCASASCPDICVLTNVSFHCLT